LQSAMTFSSSIPSIQTPRRTEAPLGFYLHDTFNFVRNPWDRIGHFLQDFVPAILVREIFLRFTPLKCGKLLICIVLSICLVFSAVFELFEWGAVPLFGEDAGAFLAV
jgi:putative membrane protein